VPNEVEYEGVVEKRAKEKRRVLASANDRGREKLEGGKRGHVPRPESINLPKRRLREP